MTFSYGQYTGESSLLGSVRAMRLLSVLTADILQNRRENPGFAIAVGDVKRKLSLILGNDVD